MTVSDTASTSTATGPAAISSNASTSVPTPTTPSAKMARFDKKRVQWKDLFTERIYLTCNSAHPGFY